MQTILGSELRPENAVSVNELRKPQIEENAGAYLTKEVTAFIELLGSSRSSVTVDDPEIASLALAAENCRGKKIVVGELAEEVESTHQQHFLDDARVRSQFLARNVRSTGKVAIEDGENIVVKVLSTRQRQETAAILAEMPVEVGGMISEVGPALAALKAEIDKELAAAKEMLIDQRGLFTRLSRGFMGALALGEERISDLSPSEIRRNIRIHDGKQHCRKVRRMIEAFSADPIEAVLNSAPWSYRTTVQMPESRELSLADYAVYGKAIVETTKFLEANRASDVKRPVSADKSAAEIAKGVASNDVVTYSRTTIDVPRNKKRRRGVVADVQSADAPMNKDKTLHELDIQGRRDVVVSLPWLDAGTPTVLRDMVEVRYQGEAVVIVDAIGSGKLRGIAEESRLKVKPADDGAQNPYDRMRVRAACMLAAGISPSNDSSGSLKHCSSMSEEYADFAVWHTFSKGTNVERGYYAFTTMDKITPASSRIAGESSNIKVLLVLAETDKRGQIQTLSHLTTASRRRLRNRRAGSI
jgi:hypothetical protein